MKQGNKLSQRTRDRIQAARIIDILQDHVFGEKDMTSTQITAASMLLKKVLPDTTSVDVEMSGPDGGPIEYADTERAARISDLLNTAGTRRAGQPVGAEIVGAITGSADSGDLVES